MVLCHYNIFSLTPSLPITFKNSHTVTLAQSYLILLEDSSDMFGLFSWIALDRAWNPLATFIIRVDNLDSTETSNYIWWFLSKYNVLNVIVVNRNDTDGSIEVSYIGTPHGRY